MEVLEPPGADNRATRAHRGWSFEVLPRGGETNKAIACRFVVGTCVCKTLFRRRRTKLHTSKWRIRRAKWKHEKLVLGLRDEPCSKAPLCEAPRGEARAVSMLGGDLPGTPSATQTSLL